MPTGRDSGAPKPWHMVDKLDIYGWKWSERERERAILTALMVKASKQNRNSIFDGCDLRNTCCALIILYEKSKNLNPP